MSNTKENEKVKYSMEKKKFLQKQIEKAINTIVNKNNSESDKAFVWFME